MRTTKINSSTEADFLVKRGIISPSFKVNMQIYYYKFTRNKLSVVGLIIVLISVFFAIFAEAIVPYPTHILTHVDFKNANLPPNSEFWFGTDVMGRDLFSRLIYSFREAILMSIVVIGICMPLGTALGMVAGYNSGKKIDMLIMRITDIFFAMPSLILALAIGSILKPGLTSAMIAACVSWWARYCRLVYGQVASVSKEYYVINARLIGASKFHIYFKEILPNILSPVFTKMALDVGWVILLGASLSFAGLGEQPPVPSFGQLLSEGSRYLPESWWLCVFPAICIAFMILGFNFFGDGIRDMLDRGRN